MQVAVFGLMFLGEQVTPGLALAILIATGSAHHLVAAQQLGGGLCRKAAGLRLASAALFAIAAIGLRGGIRVLG